MIATAGWAAFVANQQRAVATASREQTGKLLDGLSKAVGGEPLRKMLDEALRNPSDELLEAAWQTTLGDVAYLAEPAENGRWREYFNHAKSLSEHYLQFHPHNESAQHLIEMNSNRLDGVKRSLPSLGRFHEQALNQATALLDSAAADVENGLYQSAAERYEKAIRLIPTDLTSIGTEVLQADVLKSDLLNRLAWLWATSPDKCACLGAKALEYANKAQNSIDLRYAQMRLRQYVFTQDTLAARTHGWAGSTMQSPPSSVRSICLASFPPILTIPMILRRR